MKILKCILSTCNIGGDLSLKDGVMDYLHKSERVADEYLNKERIELIYFIKYNYSKAVYFSFSRIVKFIISG